MNNRIKFAGLLTIVAGLPLVAAPVVNVQSGGITLVSQNLGTAGTQASPWTIFETATGAGILRLSDTDGTPLGNTIPTFTSGNWFLKTVTNSSGVAWTSFEIELQEILGSPSTEGDGLSFAQGANLVFTSSVFSTVTRIDVTRDYLNFSGGTVAPGGTVSFLFAVTDNSPSTPFYLNQIPNRADVPEPGTIGLVGAGLAAAAWLARKRA